MILKIKKVNQYDIPTSSGLESLSVIDISGIETVSNVFLHCFCRSKNIVLNLTDVQMQPSNKTPAINLRSVYAKKTSHNLRPHRQDYLRSDKTPPPWTVVRKSHTFLT